MDLEVQVAMVKSGGIVLAALIPSLIALWSAKRLIARRKLMERLLAAYRDLKFMNELERRYIDNNREIADESFKNRMRREAMTNLGYNRSDRAQDSWLDRHIDELSRKLDQD